ncbi:hypothetical protein FRC12_009123 [Ceratobasidium sp. 428]|nr:hypothetical protein FRC12_009123 [Ceratobasidium sp. 428]
MLDWEIYGRLGVIGVERIGFGGEYAEERFLDEFSTQFSYGANLRIEPESNQNTSTEIPV